MTISVRKSLCADALISDHRNFRKFQIREISTEKCIYLFYRCANVGLAVFGLKFPSLLKYDQNRETL